MFGRGRGDGGGRGSGRSGQGRGAGRGGRGLSQRECICPACKTVTPHPRGMPCFQMNCPNCGSQMMGRLFQP